MNYPILFEIGHFTRRYKDRIENEITTLFPQIKVEPGACRINYECHNNAYHEAKKTENEGIAMVWYYFQNSGPCIHFVNTDGKTYVDNTLGNTNDRAEYYLIRHIPRYEMDLHPVGSFLHSAKSNYIYKATFTEKLFGRIQP